MRNLTIFEQPADQTSLMEKYTIEAIRFITENKDNNFFLYIWFLMSTRLHPIYNVFIITILSFCFMINIEIENLQQVSYTKESREYINRLKTMVMSIFLSVLVITVISYIYVIIKKRI